MTPTPFTRLRPVLLAAWLCSSACVAWAPHPQAPRYSEDALQRYQKKDYAAAETTLKRALEVKSDYSDARVLLSNIYSAQGLKDKAVEVMSADAGGSDPPDDE